MDNSKIDEREYLERIDESFRIYPVVLPFSSHEEAMLAENYFWLLDYLSNNKLRPQEGENRVQQQLLRYISNSTFQVKKDHSLKIEKVSTLADSNSKRVFHAQHRGHLTIFGVDMNRDSNQYFHKYKYERKGGELHFTRRITSEEKLKNMSAKDGLPEEFQGKGTKIRKQIEDISAQGANEKKEVQGVRKVFLGIANKLGYDFKEENNKIDGSEYVASLINWKKATQEKILHKKQQYILVEDFLVRTSEGIRLKALSGEILWEDKPDQSGLFSHYIRTEASCDVAEAQSVKNQRRRLISDIDAILKGNPPCLVKQFIN